MRSKNETRPSECREMVDILVCPHCGGKAKMKMGFSTCYVGCRRCNSQGARYRFRWFDEDSYRQAERRAARAWNRRIGCGRMGEC